MPRSKLLSRVFLLGALVMILVAACIPPAPTNDAGASLLLPTDALPAGQPPDTAAPPTPAAAADASASGDRRLTWPSPPEMAIDPSKIYLATLKTDKGDIVVELLADKAPVTVNNFVFLARAGYYDNTTFHRVLDGFMAQGGDPTGTGAGGPGYSFPDEFHPDLRFDEPGLLAMANAGADTNGSQFFITFVPTPHLTGKHTIFGKVVAGMEVALALRLRDPQLDPDFAGDTLQTVEISEAAASLLPPPAATPVPVAPEPTEGRPLAHLAIEERENLYTGRPAMSIDPSQDFVATIETSQGTIVVELYAADAPESVNNFVVLANLGYWDNFPINYAEPDLFVLSGSPSGEPDSDIGYSVPPEVARKHTAGSLGYWYRPDSFGSSGSEFYILLGANPGLDVDYTTFGTVTEGLDVAARLTTADTIKTITIATR